ncbi:MAG: SDR family oxidoreductase [Rhodospirillales bacterium]|jgi:NAD(P)-dependent dehydrogenase (short-subunit alcohol dehydrogenase family)|nr:SDR family oxidoreductase [Rhodospirillales bacterium]
MAKLEGKVAVITGGNSGMGLETAKRFAKEGARVAILGRDPSTLDKAVAEIGHDVLAVKGDVSNLSDLDAFYARVKSAFGKIDILFANAGVGGMAPLGAITEEHFDRLIGINLKGVVFTVQKALPLMPDGSSIILNSSIAARKGMEAFSIYSATKAAVRSLARGWTTDLRARRIRVNSISPGPIQTPIFGKMGLTEEQIAGFGQAITPQIPQGRFGGGDEIAGAALFLASDDSSYVSGIDLCVDGGMAQI